ncbi:ABC-type lipoprotein export system, ATPase component [Bifidobacterium bohemicum]|uniref:ATP-binding protein of ABC transporter n=1 Tax=Bifidobacterium bohemicum DSM 22767 TaxID=1437606 RepID=A0A086ZHT5_9BIFI|nr:ATP-binding cassette domain-containing protein [Bifidobacterium bohemicum]KFI46085.1 ATP-binding protein of ABC transporter [Bifidobacterium bohemicum DSM 22767]SCC06492.1 ABC-type lipoprotein export system, ATPase component [Bifidobacterium bohemicum]
MTRNNKTDDMKTTITPEGVNDGMDGMTQKDHDEVPYSVVFDDEAEAVFPVTGDFDETGDNAVTATSAEASDTARSGENAPTSAATGKRRPESEKASETANGNTTTGTSDKSTSDKPGISDKSDSSAAVEPATALSAELDHTTEDEILLKPNPTFGFDHVTYVNGKSGRTVLDNIEWGFFAGKLYAVTDADDEQRRAFLALSGGFANPNSGQVVARSQSIAELEVGKIRAHRIGLIPQHNSLRPDLDAQSNLVFAMRASGRTFLKPLPVVARDLLKTVGFDQAATGVTAGGLDPLNQRRLAIARAISCEAPIIIADDPARGLDKAGRETILQLLARLAHSRDPKRCVIMLAPVVGAPVVGTSEDTDATEAEVNPDDNDNAGSSDYIEAADKVFSF